MTNSIFFKLVKDGDFKGVTAHGSRHHGNRSVSIFLERGFFPKRGFLITKDDSNFDGELIDKPISASDIDAILDEALHK